VFDRVLVDPPCSGLGTLQAHPDLRWRTTPEAIAELSQIQATILAAGAQALRPGGVLVYSTCTISAAENERLIDAFLGSNPDFGLDETLMTLPHRDRTAGFFIARLHRS
jgi:16S rRNA (cytosine967-C5)-methyltransferase